MQTYTSKTDLMKMDLRNRAQLINSLGGFKSVCLIGTVNAEQETNIAIFSSIVHIGANPPLICFVMRPDAAERHTLLNIESTGCYTINHITKEIYQQAHQTSARYSKEISEFDATGLTAEFKDDFIAPYVQQSKVQLGVVFKQRLDINLNNTSFIIGEINHIYYPEDCICEDGFLDVEKAGTLTCSGLDSYHTTQRLQRLSYAKPNIAISTVVANYLK